MSLGRPVTPNYAYLVSAYFPNIWHRVRIPRPRLNAPKFWKNEDLQNTTGEGGISYGFRVTPSDGNENSGQPPEEEYGLCHRLSIAIAPRLGNTGA